MDENGVSGNIFTDDAAAAAVVAAAPAAVAVGARFFITVTVDLFIINYLFLQLYYPLL
jgi:hypothetical protein